MYDTILYERLLQVLDAEPSVRIISTGCEMMKAPRGYSYNSHIDIIHGGDIRVLVNPLGDHKGNQVSQQAEHKCTIQRSSLEEPKDILEEVVIQKYKE